MESKNKKNVDINSVEGMKNKKESSSSTEKEKLTKIPKSENKDKEIKSENKDKESTIKELKESKEVKETKDIKSEKENKDLLSTEIKEKLLKLYSDSFFKNAISANKLQKAKTDDIFATYVDVFGEHSSFSKKGDVTNVILRHAVKSGLIVVGSGMLDMIGADNYGFIRSSENNYLASNDDVYVSNKKIKKYNIQSGDIITYIINEFANQGEKDKRLPVSDICKINEMFVNEGSVFKRNVFEELTPIYPKEKFNLDVNLRNVNSSTSLISRVVDIFSPIGKGQRGIIVAPPRSGKTMLFQALADVIASNHPDVKVIILLVDERPEEVTEMKVTLGSKCKIFYSDFNESSSRHVNISEMCIEHSKRLSEQGNDVVIFMDSLTRLARAYNANAQNIGRVLSGGVDANSLQKAKKLFGTARNIAEGGSISIISTCLVETGSRMDEVIFEEFKGTGNMEIVLSRTLAEREVYPAVDILKSGTRRVDLLHSTETLEKIAVIKKYLSKVKYPDSVEHIINKIKCSKNNKEFLSTISSYLKDY